MCRFILQDPSFHVTLTKPKRVGNNRLYSRSNYELTHVHSLSCGKYASLWTSATTQQVYGSAQRQIRQRQVKGCVSCDDPGTCLSKLRGRTEGWRHLVLSVRLNALRFLRRQPCRLGQQDPAEHSINVSSVESAPVPSTNSCEISCCLAGIRGDSDFFSVSPTLHSLGHAARARPSESHRALSQCSRKTKPSGMPQVAPAQIPGVGK